MLYSLSIKNVALIDNASITLEDGFNVLTGETGAGKSILVDSLSLLLGERTDRELVRRGTDMAVIEGVFYVDKSLIQSVVDELDTDIEDDGMLIIRRTVTQDGRSTVKANGRTVTVSALRRGMQYLVDIYGQHEHQTLLRKETHVTFLDNYAGDLILKEKENCRACYEIYNEIHSRLCADWGSEAERERRMDILRFQIDEISAAELEENEEDELIKRKKLLLNLEKIVQALQEVHYALSQDGGACEAISVSAKSMESISDTDDIYKSIAERLRSMSYEADDISSEVSNCLDSFDETSDSLEQVEARLQLIRDLKRKYGQDIPSILAFMLSAQEELDRLENAAQTIQSLTLQEEKARKELHKACLELSKKRVGAADKLEKELSKQLSELGMKNACFKADISVQEQPIYTADGFDNVEFFFSANLGEPLKPLVKVISGGEMSRFMLAVKSIMADADNIGTMVFDEIDTGISGKMAQVTAEKMAGIATKHQVLCVTHLPQIAAMASSHFFICKNEVNGGTVTTVEPISNNDREREIARLSGGELTELAIAHAKEMLCSAENYRATLK